MKKLFTFFLALVASTGTILAETVQIGELYYALNTYDKTASVTCKSSEGGGVYNTGWNIVEAIIPETVDYSDETYNVTSIGSDAFSDCHSLTTVTIPNSVTSIGSYAFNSCSSLVAVTIPNSVISIYAKAFQFCSGLTSVSIPNSVTSISNEAFEGCTSLTSMTIPNSLSVIPYALFAGCSNMTSIELPSSITTIASSAFSGCNNLSIYVPCGELERFQEMLPNDNRVKNKPLPYALNTAAENGNISSNIAEITICDEPNVTITAIPNIGYHFVQWNDGVATNPRVVILTQDTTFTAEFAMDLSGTCGKDNALSWVYQPSSKTLAIIGSGELTENYSFSLVAKEMQTLMIGDGVTIIGDKAFSISENLETLNLPNSLTEIGEWAFYQCTKLAAITLPAGLKKIGGAAFMECNSLQFITIPESVEDLADGSALESCTGLKSVIWNAINPTMTPDAEGNLYSMFMGSDSINSFTFGPNVEAIPYALCAGLAGISEITIPESVKSIGDGAFYECTGLTSLTIPASVTTIGEYAFGGCSSLDSLRILNGSANVGANSIYDCRNLQYIEVPACTFNTYNYTPSSTKLKKVVVNGGALSQTGFAQLQLSANTITSIDLSKTNIYSFREEQFSVYRKLTELRLPESLYVIDYAIAADAYYLKEITIPANVSRIEDRAFDNCRSLETITFAGTALTRIGNWAFYNCHALTNIEIPAGVTEIGDGAFYGCTYMNILSLPASVQSIGDNAFALCSKLAKMNVEAINPPTVEDKTFFEVSTTAPVYVPDESVATYQAHPVWGKLNIVSKSDDLQAIEEPTANANAKATKIFRDGQFFILRGEKVYTLQGQEVIVP